MPNQHAKAFRYAATLAVLAVCVMCSTSAIADDRHRSPYSHHGSHGSSVYRHHGLGHGGYYNSHSVSRFHGLGQGYAYYNYRSPSYGYGSYCPTPYRAGYSATYLTPGFTYQSTNTQPLPSRITIVTSSPDGGRHERRLVFPSSDYAWSKLTDGHTAAAMSAFAAVADDQPYEGLPKLGYALAAALSEDDTGAVWAMRRAIRTDPGGVHYASINPTLREQLYRLIGHYAYLAGHNDESTPDWLFMIAALQFVVHDEAAAYTTLLTAMDRGDQSESAHLLLKQLEQYAAENASDEGLDEPAPGDEEQDPAQPTTRGEDGVDVDDGAAQASAYDGE